MSNSYLFEVSNKDTSLIWATYSKLTVLSLVSGIFIANCEHISDLAQVFLGIWTGIAWLFNKIHIIIVRKFNKIHTINIIHIYKFLFNW